jgi:hypothetical protein
MMSPTPPEILRQQEKARRKPLVRLIALCVVAASILLIPAGLIPNVDGVTLFAVGIALLGALVAYEMNQASYVRGAGFVILASITLGIAWEIVAKAHVQHGIDLSDLRLFDLFAVVIVLSGVLIGRVGPLVLGAATMGFTVAALLILPHTPPLQEFWNGVYPYAIRGSYYDVVVVALVIQGLATAVTWLGARSEEVALRDALQVSALEEAYQQIQLQAHSLDQQRLRLQQGIAQIQQVHAAVARGQWEARASATDGELLPLAMSLNLLLDRLGRLTRDQETRTRIDMAAHELALALQRVRQGMPYTPPPYTGTPFDEVLVELAYLRTVRLPVNSQSRLSASLPGSNPGDSWPNSMATVPPRRSWPDTPSADGKGQPQWQAADLLDRELEWPSWLRDHLEKTDPS